MRVQILCDSCCDFTATERLSSVFQKVPATVVVSGCRVADDKQFQRRALLEALRARARVHIPQFTHCRQCRADAVGVPGEMNCIGCL